MSKVTARWPVNLAHLSFLLGGAPIRAIGPDEDGNIQIDAWDSSATELRNALQSQQLSWQPPTVEPPAAPDALQTLLAALSHAATIAEVRSAAQAAIASQTELAP